MKSIVVITAGTGNHNDLTIEAGTTAQDILKQLNLSGYVLSKDSGQYVFGESENVYANVDDGEKLHAASKTDVGISSNH